MIWPPHKIHEKIFGVYTFYYFWSITVMGMQSVANLARAPGAISSVYGSNSVTKLFYL